MYEAECFYCGNKITAKYKSKLPVFCSPKCSAASRAAGYNPGDFENPVKDVSGAYICPHNVYVGCFDLECQSCGWNPEVAKSRLNRIIAELRGAVHV